MSALGPGQGSRWEGREAVSVSGKDYEWQGLLRCESCHGWTLHEGIHMGPFRNLGFRSPRDSWRALMSVIRAFIDHSSPDFERDVRRYVVCKRCGTRRVVDEAEEERLRTEGQHILHGYLDDAQGVGINTKSLADEEAVARVTAEWARGPMTVQEAERELRRRER